MPRLWISMLMCVFSLAAQGTGSPRELIEGGHYKRARAMVDARPADAETLYLKATIQEAAGDLEGAQKLAERAVAANPKEAEYHYRLCNIVGQRAEKASVFHQMGLGRTFKKECDAALALDPNHREALKLMMQFYLHAPGIIGGDKAKASAIAERLAKMDAFEGVQAQIEIAAAEKQQGRIDEIVHRSLDLRVESYRGHMTIGSWQASPKEKRYEDAERHAREAIKMFPDRVAAHSLLAALMARQEKWKELDVALAYAEKDVPDNLFAYYRAGNVLLERKVDPARAEQYFRKYLSQEPELRMPSLAAAHSRLSLALEQLGRKNDAAAEMQTAVKLDPALKKK